MQRNTVLLVVFSLFPTLAIAETAGKAQTACPVSGKAINKKVFVDFQGQRVYFCCPRCPDAFRQDPERYFAQFDREGIVLENIQSHCPVSGEQLGEHGEPAVIRFKGRTVKFCCPACEKPFRAEPEKYLNAMPGEQSKGETKGRA
ncbi:MAG: YHS domain-containing protein [Thermoanaerobaculum sp.]|nr:YHS domain-containing protein [Thermoanaerobaculum sp.]MDW7968362.1 YHS domain-containing protein [Thermoanaerobaculum sp.]